MLLLQDQARDLIHLAHEPRVSTPFLSASREAQITGLDGLLPGQLDTRPDNHGVRSSPDSFAVREAPSGHPPPLSLTCSLAAVPHLSRRSSSIAPSVLCACVRLTLRC